MSLWLALRWAKWVSVLLLAAGVAGAVLPGDLADRRRAAYWLATPGFVLAWTFGFVMARETGVSLGSPWISASMLLSLATMQAIAWGVERPDRPRGLVAAVAVAGLLGALAFMVWRPGTRLVTPAEGAPSETAIREDRP